MTLRFLSVCSGMVRSKAVPVVRWLGARIALADAGVAIPLLDPAECPP